MSQLENIQDLLFIDYRSFVTRGSDIINTHVIYGYTPWVNDILRSLDRPVRFLMHTGTIVLVSGHALLERFQKAYPDKKFVEIYPVMLREQYARYIDCARRDYSELNEVTEIVPGLYLSNAETSSNKSLLDQYNIRSIVNVAIEIPSAFQDETDFRYMSCQLHDKDTVDIQQWFEPCRRFINEGLMQGHGVLVHCAAGVSRSSTIIIAYLMQQLSMTFTEAYQHVLARRPFIEPNLGFFRQLTAMDVANQPPNVPECAVKSS